MKRVIGILLSIVLIVALLPVMPMRATTGPVIEYKYYKSQADAIAGRASTDEQRCIEVNASSRFNSGDPGSPIWYAVTGDITFSDRITVLGDVRIILCAGKTLTALKGITVADDDNDPSNGSPNSLTIYGQPEGTGQLIAKSETAGTNYNAAIGGTENQSCGTITIHGGKVEATASETLGGTGTNSCGAGIGGGFRGNGGNITINGGDVTATATATATSGNVQCQSSGAGIGGGLSEDGGNITINGGKITATAIATSGHGTCFSHGAGIGGGYEGSGGNITINGGMIDATSTATGSNTVYSNGAGIGGGQKGDGGNITINRGEVTATATATSENGNPYSHGAGIGGGQKGSGGNITISGGEVNASGGTNGEGIGRGILNSDESNDSGILTLGDGVFLYGSGESPTDILDNDGNPKEDNRIADTGSNPPSYSRLRFMKVISFINTVKLTLTKPSIGTSISTTEE